MKDGGEPEDLSLPGSAAPGELDIASEVLDRVAGMKLRARHDELVAELAAASLSSDPARLAERIGQLLRQGLPGDLLHDRLLPDAARLLGEGWREDRFGFAQVSLGSTRVQQALIGLSGAASPMAGRRQRAAVLIAVPAVEDHTIGAVVAAGRLRRKGFQVGLSMKDSDDHLLRKLEDDAVDSLFLSWSTTAVTDKLAGLVGRIRNASGCKVILGGSALADPVADPWHIAADHVTADIAAALVIAQARHDGGGPADAGDAPQQSSEGTRP